MKLARAAFDIETHVPLNNEICCVREVMLVVENVEGQTLGPCPGCLHLMQIISSELKVEMVLAFLFRFAMFEIEK